MEFDEIHKIYQRRTLKNRRKLNNRILLAKREFGIC
jgi:hypothetical protein